ncbi:hypothetical protein [Niveibacterium sp. SC-1]|uniref:hypothetical protein n=1 Tax=Niveibacterium sp. SC-1 TaxID=3135646 RepID=UPI00311D9D54
MSSWIPIAKAVLPTLAEVAGKAIPAFSGNKEHARSLEAHTAEIAELQGAVTQNAAALRTLAEQLETTVRALDEGARTAEQRLVRLESQLRLTRLWAMAASALAIVALILAQHLR